MTILNLAPGVTNPAFFKGVMWGLTLSNNGSDATNDIDIAAGVAVDQGQGAFMALTTGITKRLDAAWAAGTNQGGLDTGSIANAWYHMWAIRNPVSGVVDVLFSTSATAPTMPTGYTQKCRIGAVQRVGGSLWAFTQVGPTFFITTPVLDIDVTNDTTSATTRTLASVPTGVKTIAQLIVGTFRVTAGSLVYVRNTEQTDSAPSATAAPLATLRCPAGTGTVFGRVDIQANTSAQITTRADGASTTLKILTLGWIDPLGRF